MCYTPTMAKEKIIVIVGPTASGKSGLAIELAKKYNGEIISADSRQVYRGLDIGTAKVTKEEMDGVPHHLIDIAEVSDTYTVARFVEDAQRTIKDIRARGNLPIVVGGTFFYVDALLGKIAAPKVPPDQELRAALEALTAKELYAMLLQKDPRRAETIDRQNKRRLVRALEIVDALGAVPDLQKKEQIYDALTLGLQIEKNDLRDRMEKRARSWLMHGFIDETRALLASGISRKRLHEMGFEYQLCMDLIDQKINEETFVQSFIEKNWQYAKRQLTWLKRDSSIRWIYRSEKAEIDLLISQFLLN